MAGENALLTTLFVTGNSEKQSLTYAKLIQQQQNELFGGYAPVFRRASEVAPDHLRYFIPDSNLHRDTSKKGERKCAKELSYFQSAGTWDRHRKILLKVAMACTDLAEQARQFKVGSDAVSATERILQDRNYYCNLCPYRGFKEFNQLSDVVNEKTLSALADI